MKLHIASLLVFLLTIAGCSWVGSPPIQPLSVVRHLEGDQLILPVTVYDGDAFSQFTWVVDMRPKAWVFVVLLGGRRVGTASCTETQCEVDAVWPFSRLQISAMHNGFYQAMKSLPSDLEVGKSETLLIKDAKVQKMVYTRRLDRAVAIQVITGKTRYEWVVSGVIGG